MELTRHGPALEGLQRFWQWWRGELGAAVPDNIKAVFLPPKPRLQVVLGDGGATLHLLADGRERQLAECDLLGADEATLEALRQGPLADLPRDLQVEVYLPGTFVLRHEVVLPQAVESSLDSVLHFEIDRLTPFRPDQASLGYRLLRRHPAQGKVAVEVWTATQQRLEAILQRLAFLRLQVSAVYPPRQAGDWPTSANLLHHDRRPARESAFNPAARRAAALALGLLLATLAYPAWHMNREAAALEREIEQVRQQALSVGDKRSQLLARLQLRDQLLARRNTERASVDLLLEITRLLPGETWLSRLDIDRGTVLLQGESDNAFNLIELLEKSASFEGAGFSSPVTRTTRGERERFEIRMRLSAGGKGGGA